LWQPLFNLLVLFYLYLPGHDFGLAVIFLTILINLLLYPIQRKAVRSQLALQAIQPKLKEIQQKYKDNKEKQVKAFIELYKSQKVNPFSGIFLLFLQLPILIALYRVFWKGFHLEDLGNLYSFVPHPSFVDPSFLGLINLNQPSVFLAIIAGLVQLVQVKTSTLQRKKAEKSFASSFQKQMIYFFPLFLVLILLKLPSALALYLIVSGIFAIFQQYLAKKEYSRKK
jgi:YidC/Oxa1 family membrane protein insertase